MLVGSIASAALLAVVLFAAPAQSGDFRASATRVVPREGRFVFQAAQFEDGKARHYVYQSPEGDIRFFLVRSRDGVIRAAFDACDVCWRHKKGYVQQGNMMTCVNCGLHFPASRINIAKGGCNPAPLARTMEGGKVVIRISDVMAGLRYFR
jgi:uncharacterized membrane protein